MHDEMILVFLGFIATLIGVITPIIKLNTTITKLNTTLDSFQKQTETNHKNLVERVTIHGHEIDELTKTIIKLEKQIEYIDEQ